MSKSHRLDHKPFLVTPGKNIDLADHDPSYTAGFKDKERPHVLETLSTLGPHLLGRWDPRDMDVEVSLQDRGGKEQRVTLRTSLPGRPPLVAVAENLDITRALCDAKRELIRQLEHQKSARDPMSSRRRSSATIRH